MALATTAFTGAKLVQSRRTARAARVSCAAVADARAAGLAAALAATVLVQAPLAKADLVEDLLAKSSVNKELHDKQRLATSYANLARSRTVSDGTCAFPANVLGCDVGLYAGDVKFIADDVKLECEGKQDGKCASDMSIPQKPGAGLSSW